MQPVTLPDLSAMEPAVRAQMEAKFASLKTLLASGRSTREELATGYGAAGQLLMAANFLDAAETCFLNAQTLSAGDGRWPYYLGHIYKGKGPVDKSVSAFDRALQLMPDDVPAMIGLGEADLAAGHPENADGVFAKALARRPSEAAAWFGAGRAALARRDYRRAINQLTRALELAPQATKIHYSLAMAYRAAGDMSKATAHLARQGDVDTRVTDPLMREIDVLLQSAEAYNIRGGAELAAGHWQAAASAFRQGLELAPDDPSLRHRLGTALYQMGDVPGAMAEFQRVLQTSPGYTQSSYSLGVLLSEAGRYPEAIEHFSTALKRQPDYVEARIQLADVLRRTGRPEQALAEYARVLAAAPTNTDAAFGQAMALIRIDRYAEARDRLAALLGAHPDQAMFSHALARLLAAAPDNRVRDGRRALQLVDQLVKGEQTIELAETTAMALAEVGRYREAVDVQRDALTAATSANLPLVRRHIEANLRLYEAGTPCRTPFADDEFR
ncbi:MAG TPA: tetratricopeptide repeat protein [Vicinamibacterales bacterium]|nr:tetratricopeptide repeat protein [Vicinamibacterales bacterium]